MEDQTYVYHGSHEYFEPVIPRPNKRVRVSKTTGKREVIFDEISFHATPYKWIALAYTYTPKSTKIDGKEVYYNMGVSLYVHKKEIDVYGVNSLEESLKQLYGDGGYLYYFDKTKFYTEPGLGNLELIVQETITPLRIEGIKNPIEELKKEGIDFVFIDVSLPENEEYRNYK
jgi:hypothetical protein